MVMMRTNALDEYRKKKYSNTEYTYINVDYQDSDGETALTLIAGEYLTYSKLATYDPKENLNILKELLARGANPNHQGKEGYTALIRAVFNSVPYLATSMVEELIKYKADVNLTNQYGRTPLMMACKGSRINIITTLLAAGARVNTQDDKGDTALIFAPSCDLEEIVVKKIKILLARHADVNLRGLNGRTALRQARRYNYHVAAHIFITQAINKEEDRKLIKEAFLGGLHRRLGEKSPVGYLVDSNQMGEKKLAGEIFSYLFSSPLPKEDKFYLVSPVPPAIPPKPSFFAQHAGKIGFAMGCVAGVSIAVILLRVVDFATWGVSMAVTIPLTIALFGMLTGTLTGCASYGVRNYLHNR